VRVLKTLSVFILGCLTIAVIVLTIHDQQTIATLKHMHKRLKDLEQR